MQEQALTQASQQFGYKKPLPLSGEFPPPPKGYQNGNQKAISFVNPWPTVSKEIA